MSPGWLFGGAPARSPLSSRLCDAVAIGFGAWTVCCHAVVISGGNLHHLIAAYSLVGVAIVVFLRMRGRSPTAPDTTVQPDRQPESRLAVALRIGAIAIGAGTALSISSEENPVMVWWIAVALLTVAAVPFAIFETPREPVPIAGRRFELTLWAIAIACACIALAVHRPDLDDSFYVNVAVAAADDPERALLSGDTLLGVPELPLHMPAHRFHTYELWNGAVSYVSGIPTVYVFHWLAAAFVALLIPLCHARLFRTLTPRHWIGSVAVCTVVLLAAGETHRSYGNFAFVRSWQGKAIFLFVFMPLVYHYAIRFAQRPTRSGWLLLAAAQIGALGCSSSAIWAAPAGALTALCVGLRPTRRGLAIFAVGALASAYVLLAGALMRGELQPMLAPEIRHYPFGAQFDSALTHVFGVSRLLQFSIATLLIAWACCPRGLARRFAIVFPLAIFAVLLNPYWDRFISSDVTGPSFWRVMWALPSPVLITLVLIAPLQFDRNRAWRVGSVAACVAAVVAFAIGIPKYSTWSDQNGAAGGLGIRLDRPGLKIPKRLLLWAERLHDAVPAGSVVLAPPNISVWMPVFRDRTHPLQARRMYLERNAAVMGADDVTERMLMTRFVGGESGWTDPASAFRRGLERFDVAGVCLRESGFAEVARSVLLEAGFNRTVKATRHEIWVRGQPRGRG